MDKTIKSWDLALNECTRTFKGHTEGVQCVKLLSNYLLASGSCDKTIRIWKISSGESLKTLSGHASPIQNLELTRYNELISCSADCTIRMWNINEGKCIQILNEHSEAVWCIKMNWNDQFQSGSNGRLFSGSNDKTLKVLNWYFLVLKIYF